MTRKLWTAVGSALSPRSRAAPEIRRAISTSRWLGPNQSVERVISRTVTPSARTSTSGTCSSTPASPAIAATNAALARNEPVRKNAVAPSPTTRQSSVPPASWNSVGLIPSGVIEQLRHVLEVVDVVVVRPGVAPVGQRRQVGPEVLAEDQPERVDRGEIIGQVHVRTWQVHRHEVAEPDPEVVRRGPDAVDPAARDRPLVALDGDDRAVGLRTRQEVADDLADLGVRVREVTGVERPLVSGPRLLLRNERPVGP